MQKHNSTQGHFCCCWSLRFCGMQVLDQLFSMKANGSNQCPLSHFSDSTCQLEVCVFNSLTSSSVMNVSVEAEMCQLIRLHAVNLVISPDYTTSFFLLFNMCYIFLFLFIPPVLLYVDNTAVKLKQ